MKILKKINKGLILTIIVLVALIIYFNNLEKQREKDKVDITKACEEFISFTDNCVILPEEMQTFNGEISKENEEKIKKQLKEELKKYMVENDEAVEVLYEYLFDKLQYGYLGRNEFKAKSKRTITKISGYEFEGNQVTVSLKSSLESTYKYKDYDGTEKERQNTVSNTYDEIVLQKVDGQWKIVYAYLQFDVGSNYYDTYYETDSMIVR